MITQCATCKKIRIGYTWKPSPRPLTASEAANISHGICDDCAKVKIKEIHARRLERQLFDPRLEVMGG